MGVGTDFNHGAGITGFTDLGEALNVTRELVRRGYSQERIPRLGWQLSRVFRRVEQVSQRLQREGFKCDAPRPIEEVLAGPVIAERA